MKRNKKQDLPLFFREYLVKEHSIRKKTQSCAGDANLVLGHFDNKLT